MSMINNTNYLTLTHSLYEVTQDMNTTAERLSTGLRINSAKDDPAGLVMSENLSTYSNTCDSDIQSLQIGATFLNVVDDALDEVKTQLEAIYEIVDNAKDDSMTTAERTAFQEEIDTRWDTINSIFDDTTFKGETLFDGEAKTITLQEASGYGLGAGMFTDMADGWTKGAVDTTANATTFGTNINTYMDSINLNLVINGSFENAFDSTIDMLQQKKAAYQYEGSIIRDADIAEETTKLTTQQILQSSTTSMMGNINSYSSLYISLVGNSSIY